MRHRLDPLARRYALLLFLALATGLPAAFTGSVNVGDVKLTDGRVLKGSVVVGETAETLAILHEGKVESIEKKLLPGNLQRRWPIDPKRLPAEQRERAAAEKMQADVVKKALTPRPNPAEVERLQREAREKELALSRDGVRLQGFGTAPTSNAITLYVRNLSENPRNLAWRELRALTSDGRVLEPIDVVFRVTERASYEVTAGAERFFTVVFPSDTIAAVTWNDRSDLGWFDRAGIIRTQEAALAAAKERAVMRQRTKKGLPPNTSTTQIPK